MCSLAPPTQSTQKASEGRHAHQEADPSLQPTHSCQSLILRQTFGALFQTERQRDREKQRERERERQTDRQTDRQTERERERHTHTHTHTLSLSLCLCAQATIKRATDRRLLFWPQHQRIQPNIQQLCLSLAVLSVCGWCFARSFTPSSTFQRCLN